MGEKTMAVQLAQIETCLTDIFAQVEKPDIILFADVGQWPGYETKRRFTLENCAIAEGDGKRCDFKVEIIMKGSKPSRQVKTTGTAAVTVMTEN